MHCQECGKDISDKRRGAQFCSDACRKKLTRTNDVINADIAKPDKPTYMKDKDYTRWDGIECKFGPCLNTQCRFR